jgi:predicted PurR-regulated permease PerM
MVTQDDIGIHFRNKILFWSLGFLAFIGFVWLFNDILLPFVLGIAVAYLLNPLVKLMGRAGFNRLAATLIILASFLLVTLAGLALTIPLLYREIMELAEDLPGMIDKLQDMVEPYQNHIQSLLGKGGEDALSMLGKNSEGALGAGTALLSSLKTGGAAVTSFVTVLIVAPIVAFFMMLEWPKILDWGKDLLPRQHMDTILDLVKKIDKKLAGFVRGQFTVAVLLGLIYAVALSLAGLRYGFLIGIFAGIFSIIPMVGSTLGLLVSVLVAYLQTGDMMYVALIGGIFITGQIVEGNFLTPKLVGDSVGLHPLWVFFALMAGGALFGIVGMLIAVPVAAVFSVIIAFLLQQYKKSQYYLGFEEGRADEPPPEPPAQKTSKQMKQQTTKSGNVGKA